MFDGNVGGRLFGANVGGRLFGAYLGGTAAVGTLEGGYSGREIATEFHDNSEQITLYI